MIAFPLEYYTDVHDLRALRRLLDKATGPAFRKLNKAMCEVVQGFGLVEFIPLNIQDKELVARALHVIDRATGLAFGSQAPDNYVGLLSTATSTTTPSLYDRVYAVQDKYWGTPVHSDVEEEGESAGAAEGGEEHL